MRIICQNTALRWVRVSAGYLALIGGAYIRVLCITQIDIKVIIAYSSVSHISLALAGALMRTKGARLGAILILVCHGVTSSGLFLGANSQYLRTHSRLMVIRTGIGTLVPYFSLI